uniref:DUF4794 domain-containing protein n=1 Tax=Glossina palpalis gambiensis TaxID=67801 RepID=A0A1B0BTL2_9MUSC
MKFMNAFALLLVIVTLVAVSQSLPAKRLVYYQQPGHYFTNGPQRMMYVQYVQPSHTFARSTQAAEALVAGETVATGTYLKDCDHAETDLAAAGPVLDVALEEDSNLEEDILSAAGDHSVQSVAEAYPAVSNVEVPVEVDLVAEENEIPGEGSDSAKAPRDFNYDGNGEIVETSEHTASSATIEESVYTTLPVTAEEVEVPAVDIKLKELPPPAPISPVQLPTKRYLPSKKKVFVELEQSADVGDQLKAAAKEDDDDKIIDQDEEDVEEEESEDAIAAGIPKSPARIPNARRPLVKKPARASEKPKSPAGSFFPIDFGGTSGGAIAIANAYSTGEGGSATSHAIAYGSPEASRTRTRPSKLH